MSEQYRIIEVVDGTETWSEEPGSLTFGDLAQETRTVVREFS